MAPDTFVDKSIITIAPGAEYQRTHRIHAQRRMRPTRRNNDMLAWSGFGGVTSPRIVFGTLLHEDNGPSRPDFIELRCRPAVLWGCAVDMSLGSHRLLSQAAGREDHCS